MKERYEDRIQEVEGEKETLEELRDKFKDQITQLQTALQKANVQVEAATAAVAGIQSAGSAKVDKSAINGEVIVKKLKQS